ncbi:MAG TPA: hypothetical protein VJT67_00760 [Longimicrobiaceae bacterium]|nr:hypothetical protein [Longimicrobiaceae bacterium]
MFALFGAAIMRMAKADRERGGMTTDTTMVVSDTTSTGKPVDGDATTTTTGDESTGKPTGDTPSGEENLPEIRPVTDSTF